MPVAQGVAIATRRAVIVGLVGLASAIGLLVLMLWLAGNSGTIEVRLVQWDADRNVFFDPCDAATTFPPDGDGLEQLAWRVLDGELRIEINAPAETGG